MYRYIFMYGMYVYTGYMDVRYVCMYVRCVCMCGAYVCAVCMYVRCACMCGVYVCTVCMYVRCVQYVCTYARMYIFYFPRVKTKPCHELHLFLCLWTQTVLNKKRGPVCGVDINNTRSGRPTVYWSETLLSWVKCVCSYLQGPQTRSCPSLAQLASAFPFPPPKKYKW